MSPDVILGGVQNHPWLRIPLLNYPLPTPQPKDRGETLWKLPNLGTELLFLDQEGGRFKVPGATGTPCVLPVAGQVTTSKKTHRSLFPPSHKEHGPQVFQGHISL